MSTLTINQVADYMIHFAHESGSFISNLKLQKLLFYAQAWHLALKDQPLFDAEFAAWIHGPVNKEIYDKFKRYSFRNIDSEVEKPVFDPETESFLRELLEEYFPLDAYQLELLTHQEMPWIEARQGLSPAQPSNSVISQISMRDYYRSQAGD